MSGEKTHTSTETGLSAINLERQIFLVKRGKGAIRIFFHQEKKVAVESCDNPFRRAFGAHGCGKRPELFGVCRRGPPCGCINKKGADLKIQRHILLRINFFPKSTPPGAEMVYPGTNSIFMPAHRARVKLALQRSFPMSSIGTISHPLSPLCEPGALNGACRHRQQKHRPQPLPSDPPHPLQENTPINFRRNILDDHPATAVKFL